MADQSKATFEDPYAYVAYDYDDKTIVAICARGNADAVRDFFKENQRCRVGCILKHEALDEIFKSEPANA